MSTKERLQKLAQLLEKRKETIKSSSQSEKGTTQASLSESSDSIFALQRKKDMLKKRVALLKKRLAQDSVLEPRTTDFNEDTSFNKDYEITDSTIAGDYADSEDLEKVKNDQLSKAKEANPSLFGEDVRQAYKKSLKIAFKRFNKNLDSDVHELKASLYDKLVAYGVKGRPAMALIEASFEEAGEKFFDAVLKRADEIAQFSDEAIADLSKALEITVTLDPFESTVAVEYNTDEEDMEKEIDSSVEEEDIDELEEEEDIDELEERLKQGSFKLPKSARRTDEFSNLLSQAVPKYI